MGLFTPFAYVRNTILTPSVVFDVDAQNFFNATGIVDNALKIAVNEFVVALKNTGSLWTEMVQICPLVADTTASLATQFAVNLRNTGSHNLTFPNGVGALSNLNGFFANEANTIYANTNLIPRTVFGSNGDYSVGINTTTSGETGDAWDWGGFSANDNYSYVIIGRSLAAGQTGKIAALRPDNIANAGTTAEGSGFYNARFNTALSPIGRFTRNGVQIGSSNGGTGDIANFNAFLGAANFSGVPQSRCDKQYQMLCVGNSLTDAQMTSLNTIVRNFQIAVDNAIGTNRSLDANTTSFITAAGITNTGLKNAVNTLVLDLKSENLWNAMDIIYPFVGDNMATLGTQLSVNLKNTGSLNAVITNGTGSSDFNGYGSNEASTRYIRTGFIPRTIRPGGPYHLSIYTTTDGSTLDRTDIGSFNSGTDVTMLTIGRNRVGVNSEKFAWFGGGALTTVTTAGSNGFFSGAYDNAINPKTRLLRNGTQIVTNNTTINNSSSRELYLGANNNIGTPVQITTKQYQFASLGGGLTNAQMTTLNTIVQNFQTNVDTAMGTSRKVT